jgi:queuosine precursor transporter
MTTATVRATSTALLLAGYVGTIIAANWASTHWSVLPIGSLVVPAGTLCAGVTFTLRDLLHDTLGARNVAVSIALGAGLSWLLASPQMAVASAVAFAVSELLDTTIYTRLRTHSRLRAIVGSNLAGLLVDSVLFVPLAFGSFAVVPGQILGKTVATGLTLAALLMVRARRPVAWR